MRRPTPALALALLPLLAAACAHAPERPAPQPTPEAPNARARLYAECLGQAAQAETYERYGRYLRLTCHGGPAQALFTAMEPFARNRGLIGPGADGGEERGFSELAWDDRCFRSAQGEVSCRLTVPVGSFLDPERDVPPPPKARR